MNKIKLQKIIVIVGPTASGKTAVSLILAKEFRGQIVAADSRQIYIGMDIGTAKPARDKNSKFKVYTSEGIPHYLIDVKKPNNSYSVGQYKKDACIAIRKILGDSKLPIIVGGTGLYVSSLVDNLEIPKVKENKKLRKQLEREIGEKGLKTLYDRLINLDPEAANIVDPHNPRRVIRALEIALATGKPFSEQRKKGKPLFDFLQIGITQSPEILKMRIEKRVKKMINDGLAQEVKNLIKKYGEKQKAFDAIGYREIIQYLNGQITLEQAKELITKNTWNYAKRQMTWFNRDKSIKWVEDPQEAEKLVLNFI